MRAWAGKRQPVSFGIVDNESKRGTRYWVRLEFHVGSTGSIRNAVRQFLALVAYIQSTRVATTSQPWQSHD